MNVLTQDKKDLLYSFIGKAVMQDVMFPPVAIGRTKVSIQELIHEYSIPNLGDYIDFLEKQASTISRRDIIAGKSEKTIPGSDITFKEVIEILDILLTKKLAEKESLAKKNKLEQLIAKREQLSTPDEARAKLDKEIAELTGLETPAQILNEVATSTVG